MCFRPHLIPLVLGLSLLGPGLVRAEENSKYVCASAFADAQRQMRSGHLLEAKTKLVLCGGPQCPPVMNPECQKLLFTVETSIPTVLFQVVLQGAKAENGFPTGVRIAVDGGEAVLFDGKAIALDPGAHDFTFTADGFRAAVRKIVLIEGETLRREQVTLSPSLVARPVEKPALLPTTWPDRGRTPALRTSRPILPLIISSSLTVLAGASAIYFGVQARSDDRGLDSCARTATCSVDAVDHVRREYLWTNVSIGAAVAGLATSTVLFLLKSKGAKKANRPSLGLAARRILPGVPLADDL